MVFPNPSNLSKETSPLPMPINTNNRTPLSHSFERLSISQASATPLPTSPSSPARNLSCQRQPSATSSGRLPPPSPLHRSPSSMSSHSRSSTPTLLRKVSMNSQHGVGGASVTPSRASSSSSRRSSSAQFTNASTMVGKSPLSEIEDYTPALPKHTPASIASKHFKRELELHGKEDEARSADTIVILHDSCYGHRYSRPKTSKASLSTIVERPERIHASILGLSVAYVCLGERHAEGQFPLHPDRDASSIPSVPFRIRKTMRKMALSSQAVTNVHGAKWMEELKIMCDNAESRLAMNGKELTRPDIHRSPGQAAPDKLHEGDLYLCAESLDAMEGALGAVCEGVDAVFQGSASGNGPLRTFVAIRPPGHHCSSSYPSGFCWLNNVHVGISHAALNHGLTHAAIIDFDLHHGDGSQAIAWESNRRAISAAKNAHQWKKTSIGYFSLHDINSYPCEMGDEEKVKNASLCIENAHGQSIWNVHLQPWKSEQEFWDLYETRYSVLLEKTRNYLRNQTERLRLNVNGPKPKGAIFLSAGFDASEWESSGMQRHKVNVPTEFYARLTRDVVQLAGEEGLAVDGRIISVLEGGYSDRALCTGVLSHLSGMSAGDPMIIKKERSPTGLGYEMSEKIGSYERFPSPKTLTVGSPIQNYDPIWWSLPRLEQLDALVHPKTIPTEPRIPRAGPAPTYSSPTQSFIAKVSPSARRNVSNMGIRNGSPRTPTRGASPPPPDVIWTVAAHELSKLLIPVDRQTMSCMPEDLSAEATRARRERQPIVTPPTTTEPSGNPSSRMALRARKPAKPLLESEEEDVVKKAAPKANRRKTVAGAAALAANTAVSRSTTPMPDLTKATARANRRLSLSSNADSVTSEAPPRQNGYRVSLNGAMSTRPVTSQSVRPESSMSVRGQSIPPITVKKTRAPAQPRAEAPKTARVRRKSPLNGSGASTGSDTAIKPPLQPSSVVLPSIERPAAQATDIDSLTSGIKKIKINLTTKAQREAKAAAVKAAVVKPEKTTGLPPRSESAILPPRPQAPASSINGTSAPPQQPEPGRIAETLPPKSATPHSSPATHLHQANEVPLPASSPPACSTKTSPPQPPPGPTRSPVFNHFIPYQPAGPAPQSLAPAPQEPLRWLKPNTNTPSPMKKPDLPVFTSTSAIPFGISNSNEVDGREIVSGTCGEEQMAASTVDGAEAQTEVDIWEVPETPHRA